jgi:hypothetical protein
MTSLTKEPFNCAVCQRRIGKTSTHYLTPALPTQPICVRCLLGKDTHARLYPQCEHRWHRVQDHKQVRFCTRAAARLVAEGKIRRK